MNQIHSALGAQGGFMRAAVPDEIFTSHEMLELPKEEDEE